MKALLVDDFPGTHKDYGPLLQAQGFEVVHRFSGESALAYLDSERVDLVIMDISMPNAEMDGIEACREIRDRCRIPVLILTVAREFQKWEPLAHALLAGATGFVDKKAEDRVFLRAVQHALAGGRFFEPEEEKEALREWDRLCRKRKLYKRLTRREKQVLDLLRQGLMNREIAERLTLSVQTVNQYVSNILTKLEVTNRVQAAVFGTTGWEKELL